MTRIHIGYVVSGFQSEFFGGAERFVINLTNNLDNTLFDILIFGLWQVDNKQPHPLWLNLKNNQKIISLSRWNPNFSQMSFIYSLYSLSKYLSLYPIDILHSHSQFGDIICSILKLAGKSHVIVRTKHDGYLKEWRRRPIRRILFSEIIYPLVYDAEIGVSKTVSQFLNKRLLFRLLNKKTHYIPNAIDLNKFTSKIDSNQKRLKLGIDPSAFLIATISRISYEKRIETVIKSLSLLHKYISNIHLLIVGDGIQLDYLKKLSINLGVNNLCTFLGFRDDVEEIIKCIDLLIIPSTYEGLPTVALEGMASGIPILASNVPSNNELIVDGYNGLLFQLDDIEHLTIKILKIYQDKSLAKNIIENAQKTVTNYYINIIAKQHATLYQNLLSRTRMY